MSASGHTGPTGAPPDRLRIRAIEVYCRELCGSEHMSVAADDVVSSISPADAGRGDDQLLRVTRTAAAAHAPRRTGPRGLRGMLAAEHETECDLTPGLLAELANGELPPARQFKLENHLHRCLFCRASALRERRASRSFSAVLATGDPASSRGPAPSEAETEQPTEAFRPVVIDTQAAAEARSAPEPPLAATAPGAGPERRGLVVFPAGAAPRTSAPPLRLRAGKGPWAMLAAYTPFLVTLALGAVVVAAVGLALGGRASSRPAAASLPPPSASFTPPASVGIAITQPGRTPSSAHRPSPQAATTQQTTATSSSAPTTSARPNASAPAAVPPAGGTSTAP